MTDVFFFDSYAVIELLQGNKNYRRFFNSEFFLTKLNTFEIHNSVIKRYGEDEAEKKLNEYYRFVIDFKREDIINASKLKIKNKNLSMADCIGYVLAKRIGIKFLTGDKEFKRLDNVEFVR